MSLDTVHRCDECRAIRGITNHWWAVMGTARQPVFLTSRAAKSKNGKFRLDFCSHNCVGTAFHRWLDTGSVTKRKTSRAAFPLAPTKEAVDCELAALDALQTEPEYARLVSSGKEAL